MTLKKNLLLGLGLSLSLLFISSWASFVSIRNLIDSAQMVRSSNTIIKEIDQTTSLVKDAETGQRGYLLTGDPVFLEPYTSAKLKLQEAIHSLSAQLSTTPQQAKNFEMLRTAIDNRLRILDENLIRKRSTNIVTTDQLLLGKQHMDEIRNIVNAMHSEEQMVLRQRTEDMEQLASFTPYLIVVTAILAIAITLFFYKKVSSDYDEKLLLNDELEMKNKEAGARLAAIEKVSEQISEGDYDILFDRHTEASLGIVASALRSMATSLKTSFSSLKEQEWLSSSLANLNVAMMGDKPMGKLAADILQRVVEHTGSSIAAVYILENDNALHLTGSYALEQQKLNKILKPGQGIAGEAFRSGNRIIVDNLEENGTTVSFASGSVRPKNIIAVPLSRYNIPIGVLELGSVKNYTPLQLEFLNEAAGTVGLAFFGAQSRLRMQELLEETQSQAEELQVQHTELENINAELEAQSQKLLASEEELRVQQEELLQSNQELEERTELLEEKNALIEQHNIDIQQKSIELEQSTKYKSEFLANMSHELRTPLNSILLLSKLMTESEELDPQYVEYAEVMQSSGQGLLTLIDEILDLSKIEAGKMTLNIDEVPVTDVARDMEQLFRPVARDKDLSFTVKNTTDLSAVLHTDKLRLEQILKNLLSNAMKFTAAGEVSLNITADEISGNTHFSVKDTGIGIPKNKIGMVFEAFQQADGSTQRKYGGTGLGLSISRELARLLGGDITLESTEGKGSQFTLTVPFRIDEVDKEAEKKIAEVSPKTEKTPARKDLVSAEPRFTTDTIPQPIADDRESLAEGDRIILIVEDDTAFAKILLDFTRQKGYKGIVAVRGDVGIEMAQMYRPLAILLDIQLPVMDGWQVMDALKSNPETKPIPVHIMSSLKFKQESLLRGAVDFINKPFALDQMQAVFKKLEDALTRSPKKVLIVEENEQHAKALSYFLSTNNINTDITKNVQDSIEALRGREIDCVILDMGVPDRSAYDTLEIIKKSEGLEQLPIIVFTGKNLSKGEESRIKKYADSIVVKTAYSYQRILDEAGLFLHLVEEKKNRGEAGTANTGELRHILKDKTVLIADDDVRNIFSLTKALEGHGMKILSAMDGKEALKVLRNEPKVDVVLMDMMMPEMDGYESIRTIRATPEFRHLPVLAVTSKAMMGDREKCIAVGASDYISKPVDIDQLVSLLRVWLYDRI